MSTRTLRSRLDRLDGGGFIDPADCDGPPTALVSDGELFDPATPARCPRCGGVHPVEITEVVVTPGGLEVPAALYAAGDAAGG